MNDNGVDEVRQVVVPLVCQYLLKTKIKGVKQNGTL